MKTDLGIAMVHWCVHMKMYQELRQKNMSIVGIHYEDIIADPENAMKKIFAYCGLPTEFSSKAIKALTWDSQKNTALSSENFKKMPLLPFNGKAQQECDELCQHYGFPPASQFQEVEGTITSMSLEEVQQIERS